MKNSITNFPECNIKPSDGLDTFKYVGMKILITDESYDASMKYKLVQIRLDGYLHSSLFEVLDYKSYLKAIDSYDHTFNMKYSTAMVT